MIDIVQYADGNLEVLHRGKVLCHRSFTVNEHLRKRQVVGAKEVNVRVDDAIERQRRAIAKVLASVQHQQRQRDAGIRVAPAPANSPPRAPLRSASLRTPQATLPPPGSDLRSRAPHFCVSHCSIYRVAAESSEMSIQT